MYTNYRTMIDKIKHQINFDGNSVSGYEVEGLYTVKSFRTDILRIKNGEVVYFDNGKYSATTSKLQNMIIRGLELDYSTRR